MDERVILRDRGNFAGASDCEKWSGALVDQLAQITRYAWISVKSRLRMMEAK